MNPASTLSGLSSSWSWTAKHLHPHALPVSQAQYIQSWTLPPQNLLSLLFPLFLIDDTPIGPVTQASKLRVIFDSLFLYNWWAIIANSPTVPILTATLPCWFLNPTQGPHSLPMPSPPVSLPWIAFWEATSHPCPEGFNHFQRPLRSHPDSLA